MVTFNEAVDLCRSNHYVTPFVWNTFVYDSTEKTIAFIAPVTAANLYELFTQYDLTSVPVNDWFSGVVFKVEIDNIYEVTIHQSSKKIVYKARFED